MAPERLQAREVDARADIYALACVLYECLTGCRPFPGDSVESQVAAHLNAPPPQPSYTHPGLPRDIDSVIARGMAKDPRQRYATTVELADAARDAITQPFSIARPSPATIPAASVSHTAQATLSPYAYPPSRERERKSRKKLRIGLSAFAVFAVAALAAVVVVAIHPWRTSASAPDITAITAGMLVERSSFPVVEGGEWDSGIKHDLHTLAAGPEIQPAECAVLLGFSNPRQIGYSMLVKNDPADKFHRLDSWAVGIWVVPQRPDLKALMQKCNTFTGPESQPVKITPLNPSGLPEWAVAYQDEIGSAPPTVKVKGYCRGVEVMAEHLVRTDARVDDLVKLFKDQVSKLQSA
jgi:hypothetical protein